MAFPWEANEPWAGNGSEAPEADESDPVEYDRFTPDECGDELFNLLAELKKRGTLSAKHVCVCAFVLGFAGWGCRAYLNPGEKPSVQSGQFSAHFDRATKGSPKDARDWYELPYQGTSGVMFPGVLTACLCWCRTSGLQRRSWASLT